MRRVRSACITAWCCVMLVASSLAVPAQAAPTPTFSDLNPAPTRIILGADGALWFTEYEGNRIGRLTLSGAFSFYTVPTPRSGPSDLAAAGRYIWFTEQARAALGRLDTTTGAIVEYPVPTAGSWPTRLVVARDGGIWFTEARGDCIGHLDPTSGHIAEYPLRAGATPYGIAVGPDGGIWFTENAGQAIGRIAADGSVRAYSLLPKKAAPHYTPDPVDIVVGPDAALWVSEPDTFQVARLTTGGTLTQYSSVDPANLTVGRDGNIWYVRTDDVIGRFDTHGKSTFSTGTPAPPLLQPAQLERNYTDLLMGPDGAIWLAASKDNAIERLVVKGTTTTFTRYQIPGSSGEPVAVAPAPDGALWIAQPMLNAIGRRTPDGVLHEYTVPTPGAEPNSLAVAADGSVWFSEPVTNRVGHLSTSGVFTEYPLARDSDPVAVALSRDGHTLWVAERSPGLLACLDTRSGAVTTMPVPGGNHAFVDALTLDVQGNLWFGLQYSSMLGVVSATGATRLVSGTHDSYYGLLRPALEGGVWVAGQYKQNRLDRATGAVKLDRYYLPTRYATPNDVVENHAGSVWFTEGDADQVAHLDMASRKVTEYPVPTSASDPTGICVDSHGTIWFTERAGNALATVSPAGVIHEYPLPVAPASMPH